MTAGEINELCFARGVISAEGEVVDLPFELLGTDVWQIYCDARKLSSGGIKDRMFRIGLAKKMGKQILPTKAENRMIKDSWCQNLWLTATKKAVKKVANDSEMCGMQ